MGICKDLWEFQSCSISMYLNTCIFEEPSGLLQHQFTVYFDIFFKKRYNAFKLIYGKHLAYPLYYLCLLYKIHSIL